MRPLPLVASLAIAALATLAACEIKPLTIGGTPTTDGGGDTSTFCEEACTAQQKCDPSTVLSTCESGCVATYSARYGHLRADWVDAVAACLTSASCGAWTTGLLVSSCEQQASASVTATAAAQTYCKGAVNKDAACGVGGGGTVGICLDTAKMYSDATLQAATNCLANGCDSYATCVRSVTGS